MAYFQFFNVCRLSHKGTHERVRCLSCLPQKGRNQLYKLSSGDDLLIENDETPEEILIGLRAAQGFADLKGGMGRGKKKDEKVGKEKRRLSYKGTI